MEEGRLLPGVDEGGIGATESRIAYRSEMLGVEPATEGEFYKLWPCAHDEERVEGAGRAFFAGKKLWMFTTSSRNPAKDMRQEGSRVKMRSKRVLAASDMAYLGVKS